MQLRKCALAVLLAGVVAAVGCAGEKAFRDGRNDELMGRWDKAVVEYARAQEENPRELKYKMAFDNAKRKASEDHFEKGKMYLNSGRPDLAVIELEQTTLLNPENDYAKLELKKARDQAAKLAEERKQPGRIEALTDAARGARAVGPILQPTSKKPISLNFPQPRPIKQIYQALGQAAGINMIFDPALKDDQASIVLSNVNFQSALETLLRQENHFYKVTDEHTILIAADTPANRKTYEDLVIRSFYLSNGDVTETANAIRALLGTVHVSINKQENAITIRDTADKVSIAQSIIDQNDKEKAEVVVDIELLQMNTTKLSDIGVTVPTKISALLLNPATAPTDSTTGGTTTTTGTTSPTTASVITLEALKHLSLNQYGFTVPNFTVNLLKGATDAQVIAKPELRITEGEKAQLIIGDKVPIPTTTFNTQTAVGGTGAIVPITSFQYQDVGINIEMEPRVHHNKEVTLKLMVEVSNLNGDAPGTTQPIISTRTISSTIRLKDGETNFLAGLIRKDKQLSSSDIPFLSDLPIIGRLFSDKNKQDQTTDLVMTITPHIIRVPDINAEDLMPVFVGTENNISYRGAPQVESFSDKRGPFDNQSRRPGANRPAAPPAQPIQPAPGINLAPSGGPSNLFAPPKANAIPRPEGPTPPPPPGAALALPTDPSTAAAASTPVVAFAFEPASVVLNPGEEQTVDVTSSGGDTLTAANVAFEFDPAVVQVAKIDSLEGSTVTPMSSSRLALALPDGFGSAKPRTIARVTLRGIATGSASVRLDASSLADAAGTAAIVSAGAATVEVK